ncbi:hypothetical protein CEXT_126431 [Caerostris extrusa]|uniref:Uncharacterized protein n=1 Tax=Caerostris extrusa TaxID=172846 RepID=A0AAV4NTU2_CAEEX|nr:hypothetical protein CEXT_126431 [Caerostris extrusa]
MIMIHEFYPQSETNLPKHTNSSVPTICKLKYTFANNCLRSHLFIQFKRAHTVGGTEAVSSELMKIDTLFSRSWKGAIRLRAGKRRCIRMRLEYGKCNWCYRETAPISPGIPRRRGRC